MPQTVAALLTETALQLAEAGFGDARREARGLLALALRVEPLALLAEPQRPVAAEELARLERIRERRTAGEPLSRIAGARGFWSLDLHVSPAVLDPRPDTELLVERVLAHFGHRRRDPLRLLDLGTGSGCIALALLAELPNAFAIGTDRSPEALAIARENARSAGLGARAAWLAADWSRPISGRFDAVVSNPPYIPAGALATLDRSVRDFDPAAALDGGPDGLVPYRQLLPALPQLLAQTGIACVEVGVGQAPDVAKIGRGAGLLPEISHDLAGIQRCVSFISKKGACKVPTAR